MQAFEIVKGLTGIWHHRGALLRIGKIETQTDEEKPIVRERVTIKCRNKSFAVRAVNG